MTWQGFLERSRKSLTAVRTRVTVRRVVKWTLAVAALSLTGATIEALTRAHLASPESRLPTAFYSRPVAWNPDRPGGPIAIGTLNGAPLENRIPILLDDVPEYLVNAVLAVEDQHFFSHHGLDFRRIGGALFANVRAGGIAQGGSTITQQLSKNLFLSSSRTPLRKLREAAMAAVLEARYSKSDILAAYLNEIYLGQDGGRAIHGVGAAARFYFGKEARRLTLAESALLAGMIHAPNRYAPSRHPEAARQRRNLVLQLMAEQKRISDNAARTATRAKLSARTYPMSTLDARYFRDYVGSALMARPAARGVAVYTSLDARLQRAAEKAVRKGLDRLPARGAEAALVAIDPQNGDVLAMVGGRDYSKSQFNRAVQAHRQPGSAFKPIVALAALEPTPDGAPAFTLASVVRDEPLSIRVPNGRWEPQNYDGAYHGSVTLRRALELSLNVPFARIGLTVGPDRIINMARRVGVTSPMSAVPSIALGSSEVTLVELVRAYGVLAAAGELATTRSITSITPVGQDVEEAPLPSRADVVDPAVAYLVTSALEGVVTRGTGHTLNQDGHLGDVAGKTGTSSDWRDAWFVAYSPTLVVGVWVGYDDSRSLGTTGAEAALPIAELFLDDAMHGEEGVEFAVPEGISEGYAMTGGNEWFPDCGSREYFLTGTEPAHGDCGVFEVPRWNGGEGQMEWQADLARQAQEMLRELIKRGGIEIKGRRRR